MSVKHMLTETMVVMWEQSDKRLIDEQKVIKFWRKKCYKSPRHKNCSIPAELPQKTSLYYPFNTELDNSCLLIVRFSVLCVVLWAVCVCVLVCFPLVFVLKFLSVSGSGKYKVKLKVMYFGRFRVKHSLWPGFLVYWGLLHRILLLIVYFYAGRQSCSYKKKLQPKCGTSFKTPGLGWE